MTIYGKYSEFCSNELEHSSAVSRISNNTTSSRSPIGSSNAIPSLPSVPVTQPVTASTSSGTAIDEHRTTT